MALWDIKGKALADQTDVEITSLTLKSGHEALQIAHGVRPCPVAPVSIPDDLGHVVIDNEFVEPVLLQDSQSPLDVDVAIVYEALTELIATDLDVTHVGVEDLPAS